MAAPCLHALWYSREWLRRLTRMKLLNKAIIFVFFAYKKYSCSFIKLRFNHWCHMDYFNNALILPFWALNVVVSCCLWRVKKLSDFIKNISICIPKMNKGLTVWNDMRANWQSKHFWVNYPFNLNTFKSVFSVIWIRFWFSIFLFVLKPHWIFVFHIFEDLMVCDSDWLCPSMF